MMFSMNSCAKPAGRRQGYVALAGIFAAALSVHAQTASVLDDFESASDQNMFLGYSYFYADGKDGGNSTISTSTPGAAANELKLDKVKAFADAGYTSTKSLKLDFTMGTTKPSSGGNKYGNMVGFGTQFIPGTDNPDGSPNPLKTLDLTGATGISFYAKASALMSIRVEVTTTGVLDYGYHVSSASITTDWAKVTVALNDPIAGIKQPTWAKQVPFDPTKVQKLQIAVSTDDNTGLTAGTLWIDNITVENYAWVPPNACVKCVSETPATGAVLGDCEPGTLGGAVRSANQNATGGYWFAYNDLGTRTVTGTSDYSEIFQGVTIDTLTKAPVLAISAGKGASASGGAYIKFQLGKSYLEGTNTVMPFVGIGTKTSDNLDVGSTNFTGATAVAFDYMTDADSKFKFIRLEVKTKQANLGSNAGAVHSVLIPATAGLWKTANIPWEKFSLPDWQEIPDKTVPVDIKTVLKFQWAVQDAPGTTGGFAIDNVKMVGLTAIPPLGIRTQARAAKGLRMSQGAGKLDVSYVLPLGVNDAEVSLVDMKGVRVASGSISGKGEQRASLDTRNLNSGLYSLQVRHGKVVRGMAVTLLK